MVNVSSVFVGGRVSGEELARSVPWTGSVLLAGSKFGTADRSGAGDWYKDNAVIRQTRSQYPNAVPVNQVVDREVKTNEGCCPGRIVFELAG